MVNKKPRWHKQVDVNTKRMKQLMRDVRTNVTRLTRNSRDIDEWMENLSQYTAQNPFVTGAYADEMRKIVNNISDTINRTSLPAGSTAEIMKGAMSEACMTMVTNVGEDMRNDLRRIAIDSYNQKNTPAQTAKLLGDKITSLDKTRCQCIARTETMRAGNLANLMNAREDGMKSWTVDCHEEACPYCVEAYRTDPSDVNSEPLRFSIDDTAEFPPFHPNCRCVPLFWPDPVE